MYRVMIVEDELFIRVGIRMTVDWQALDLELVAEAGGGQEALELYQRLRPEIIITDIRMAGMDGIELIRKIREHDQDTRILILSNLDEFNTIRRVLTLNVSDYLIKLTMTQEAIHAALNKVKKELALIERSRTVHRAGSTERECGGMILSHLLYGWYSDEELNRATRQLPAPFAFDRLMLAVMKIENFEEVQDFFDDQYGDLVGTAFSNVLEELLKENGLGLVIRWRHNSYILLMDVGHIGDDREAEGTFLTCLGQVEQVLATHFGSLTTFGVGGPSLRGEAVREVYGRAVEALHAGFYLGKGGALIWREVAACDLYATVAEKLRALCEDPALDEQGRELLETGIEGLRDDFGPAAVASLLSYLASHQAGLMAADARDAFELVRGCEAQLMAGGTVEEMVEVIRRLLRIQGGTRQVSSSIARVLAYIHSNYSGALTLEAVAEHASLSKNYLSSLFKKEMGLNLIQYVTAFRVEQAKRLLLDTGLKSYEVAEKVGFANESYFSRSFKRLVGKSPHEFRREVAPLDGATLAGNAPTAGSTL